MTDNNHPITPPPELLQQWWDDIHGASYEFDAVVTQATRWGADQELEACCEWVSQFDYYDYSYGDRLQAVRRGRPKPPSLKEQAQRILVENGTTLDGRMELDPDDIAIIRRALEQLDD